MNETLTSALAKFTFGLRPDSLPAATLVSAKKCLLDWLSSCIGGSETPPGRIALKAVRAMGAGTESTLIPYGTRTSMPNAALHNGTISHIMELDDVHRASIIHPGAAVIPAALAVAEVQGAGGMDLLAAIVAGYEVAIRVGEAAGPSHYKYWHSTATCGVFGAAAAAARLLGLDATTIDAALGTAGTEASGLWEFLADGAMSKHLHPGKAAMDGVIAALFSREGFTAARRILEGERGFLAATSPGQDQSRITDGLGQGTYRIDDVSFKIHASCRHTHPAVDAVLELVKAHDLRPSGIASIVVETYSEALAKTDNPDPTTPYAARFSLQFCTSLAIAHRRASPADFTPESLVDPTVRELMSKVRLAATDTFNAVYPAHWSTKVTVTTGPKDPTSASPGATRDGAQFSVTVDNPRGDPENPVSLENIYQKFLDLTVPVVGWKLAEETGQAVLRLESMRDVNALTGLFGRGTPA